MAKSAGGIRGRRQSTQRQKSVRELGEQYRRLTSMVGAESYGRISRAYLSTRRDMERIVGNDIDRSILTSLYRRRR